MSSQKTHLSQEIFDPALDHVSLGGMDVFFLCAEPTGGLRTMQRDALHAVVQNANRLTVPANPDVMAKVFGGNRVIRSINSDMPIARNFSLLFFIIGKSVFGERIQPRLLGRFKSNANVLLRRSVNPRVCDRSLPVIQIGVLLCQTFEASCL